MGSEQLAWSGRDWRMPVWLWVGLATMFVSALHIIIDFGVGLFDLHGTLTLTEAATLVGVALIQVWWAISFMAGARGNGSGVASAGILGAGWAALTNGFPIVYCPPVSEEARPPTDLGHLGSIAGNGGREQYRALVADRAAWELACRPKPSKLAGCARLPAVVEEKLEVRWSPEQIAGWLARQFPDQAEMQVSHETIYRSLFVQSRGALRKELTRHLRTKRAMRRPAGRRLPDRRGGRLHELTISDRPAEVEDRAVPGHWEGDLVFGRGMTAIATLVERSTRFVMLVALPHRHKSEQVVQALAASIHIQTLPRQLTRSLTWDQGHQMALHAKVTVATGVAVYFGDPNSPGNVAATRTPMASCASTFRAR